MAYVLCAMCYVHLSLQKNANTLKQKGTMIAKLQIDPPAILHNIMLAGSLCISRGFGIPM